jgi:hypothetical protein
MRSSRTIRTAESATRQRPAPGYGHNPLIPLRPEDRREIYRDVSTERLFAAVDRLLDRYAAGAMDIRCVQTEFQDLSAEIEDRCREARTVLLASADFGRA